MDLLLDSQVGVMPPPAQMASVLNKTETVRGHLDVPRAVSQVGTSLSCRGKLNN